MKCNNCNITVNPGFTKALKENACPACGKEIMDERLFKEFNEIIDMLNGAEIEEADLVKVSALIAGKYSIVPKGQGRFATGNKVKPITRVSEEDRDADLIGLSEAERLREKALRDAEDAKLIEEFGLNVGQLGAGITGPPSGDFSGLDEAVAGSVTDVAADVGGSGLIDMTDPFTAQRMAKLHELKKDPSYGMIRRSDD